MPWEALRFGVPGHGHVSNRPRQIGRPHRRSPTTPLIRTDEPPTRTAVVGDGCRPRPGLTHAGDGPEGRRSILRAVVRVKLVNGRTLWIKAVEDDHENSLRAINGRGRAILVSKMRVKAVEAP